MQSRSEEPEAAPVGNDITTPSGGLTFWEKHHPRLGLLQTMGASPRCWQSCYVRSSGSIPSSRPGLSSPVTVTSCVSELSASASRSRQPTQINTSGCQRPAWARAAPSPGPRRAGACCVDCQCRCPGPALTAASEVHREGAPGGTRRRWPARGRTLVPDTQ